MNTLAFHINVRHRFANDVQEEIRNSETEITISDILKFICPMFKIILVFTQNFLIEIAYHEKTCLLIFVPIWILQCTIIKWLSNFR